MRIRRRPQAASAAASDLAAASTAPQTPLNAARNHHRSGWLLAAAAAEEEDEDREAKMLLHASSADLVLGQKSGVARRLALPQDDNVVVDCGSRSRSMGGGAQAQHGADDDGRMRFSAANGHGAGSEHKDAGGAKCADGVVGGGRYEYESAVKAEEQRTTSNGFVQQPAMASAAPPAVAAAVAAVVKDEGKKQQQATSNGGPKKRRGPAVLLEGSRCSRVNGRGWRCSQPTLVGYALCEHHLGKGRMRSAAAAAAARGGGAASAGVGRLGRTEHGAARIAAAASVVTAAAPPPPNAEGPSLPGC